MTADLVAIAILVVVFAVAAIRKVHLGVVALAAATGVGLWLADLPLDDIIAGFPVGIFLLLVGVTYFFGIAQVNGTIDTLVEKALQKVGTQAVLIPFVFFFLTMGVSAMGSALAGLVMAPVGMPLARRFRIDPMLMALAIGCGLSAGGFAPTSLFGIVTYGTARDNGIALSPVVPFAVALVVNLLLLGLAFLLFGGRALLRSRGPGARQRLVEESVPDDATTDRRLAPIHWVTIAFMVLLVAVVVVLSLTGHEPEIGTLCFAFAAVLALLRPLDTKRAIAQVDWSTALLVGGIVTYIGVLRSMGALDTLGELAARVHAPLVGAVLILMVGALMSAFVSTTGILASLVPLAIPIVASGAVPGWALIAALGVCSSLVDVSPFSTVGATLTATSDADDRARVTRLLTRWGMSMVVIGPVLLMLTLVVPAGM
ncbi:SLC13 family permease [Cumulibacter manganitolerans]|uniref:SLC13 family permease n=1 Tax=Cumulibacter manganitolerans TaxID=1884992 RepID=UPI001295C358|nr:SLC13 family permease [Cumulibacter manganitolerans]